MWYRVSVNQTAPRFKSWCILETESEHDARAAFDAAVKPKGARGTVYRATIDTGDAIDGDRYGFGPLIVWKLRPIAQREIAP